MTDFLETNGARIAYDVRGSGEAVVLIHAGVANRSMWDDQVAALEDAYRVIRYDTRGFGETETDAVEFSNRADIAALFPNIDIDADGVRMRVKAFEKSFPDDDRGGKWLSHVRDLLYG